MWEDREGLGQQNESFVAIKRQKNSGITIEAQLAVTKKRTRSPNPWKTKLSHPGIVLIGFNRVNKFSFFLTKKSPIKDFFVLYKESNGT
mgnify:CR=1 FL=1